MADTERVPDHEMAELAAGLASTYIQRWDCYPLQLADGRYVCVKKPLTLELVEAHLRGEITLGAYALDKDSNARWICFDADDDFWWCDVVGMVRHLTGGGVPAYLETSARGGHAWFFFGKKVPGREARELGRALAAAYDLTGIEIFPKQDALASGPGSLVRLPFGRHRKTGRRYHFVTPTEDIDSQPPIAPTIREQLAILAHPAVVPEVMPEWATEPYLGISDRGVYSTTPEPEVMKVSPSNAETVSKRIKESVSVLEFVSQYVDLDSRGKGRCPFHDDEHPSFAVNDRGNYWQCFAGCGGGSVIDFWAKWREKQGEDPAFVSTITELAGMLFE